MPVSYIHVYFSGRVQGVGFRYQTLDAARGFEVAGWVRNLPDGRVEMEAEGDSGEVSDFLDAVCWQMEGFIRNVEKENGVREASLKGFSILH